MHEKGSPKTHLAPSCSRVLDSSNNISSNSLAWALYLWIGGGKRVRSANLPAALSLNSWGHFGWKPFWENLSLRPTASMCASNKIKPLRDSLMNWIISLYLLKTEAVYTSLFAQSYFPWKTTFYFYLWRVFAISSKLGKMFIFTYFDNGLILKSI
jgi:hypothetical protein